MAVHGCKGVFQKHITVQMHAQVCLHVLGAVVQDLETILRAIKSDLIRFGQVC